MLKYQEEWTLSRMAHFCLLMVVWVVLQVLWPANPSASWWPSCGQWRFFVLHLLLLVSSSWLVLSVLEMKDIYKWKIIFFMSSLYAHYCCLALDFSIGHREGECSKLQWQFVFGTKICWRCCKIVLHVRILDRLCGLVVRVLDYRHRGPGFDSRALQKK
jgi:hypothetical protein